jgi:hypothetical protein
MKKRPKLVSQVFQEKWPEKSKQEQKNDYNSSLQHQLDIYLPQEWLGKIKVANYNNGLLEVEIDNAAFKMRFNSIRLNLLTHLRQIHPELITISDRVNPQKKMQVMQTQLKRKTKPVKTLSNRTQLDLSNAAQGLPENLQAAMARLIKTASGKTDD